jgi:hypothetical protein
MHWGYLNRRSMAESGRVESGRFVIRILGWAQCQFCCPFQSCQLSMLRPFAPNLDTLLASGPHKTFAPVKPDSESLALPTIFPSHG